MAASTDFARAQLEKYGWKEGKGLGKQENGRTAAIKPKLKFNNNGLGYDNGLEYKCFWWNQVFNTAASNIIVKNANNNVAINVLNNNKKRKLGKPEITTSQHKIFVKAETLQHNSHKVINTEVIENTSNLSISSNFNLDDDVFKKCNGRTAHKAARHGLRMSAKLIRLQKQEESFAGPKEKKRKT